MDSPNPFADAMRTWFITAAGLPPGQSVAPSPLDPLLIEAHLGASAALLRSGQRAARSWLEYSLAASATAELAARVDAARAHLRRLAEIAADEAHLVEQQMRVLDERVRGLAAPAGSEDAPVRRAQAKP
jgi:hypothetical protein